MSHWHLNEKFKAIIRWDTRPTPLSRLVKKQQDSRREVLFNMIDPEYLNRKIWLDNIIVFFFFLLIFVLFYQPTFFYVFFKQLVIPGCLYNFDCGKNAKRISKLSYTVHMCMRIICLYLLSNPEWAHTAATAFIINWRTASASKVIGVWKCLKSFPFFLTFAE